MKSHSGTRYPKAFSGGLALEQEAPEEEKERERGRDRNIGRERRKVLSRLEEHEE